MVIGAIAQDDIALFNLWYPIFEAFEAGLWQFCLTKNEIVYLPLPAVHLDSERRPHNDNGYAFEWLDGGDFYWHGARVPEQIIMQPDSITVAQIQTETNVEVRRVMLERYRLSDQISGEVSGEALFIEDIQAKPQKADGYGAIYTVSISLDEPLCLVKVTCPSTARVYWLRVDPRAYNSMASREPQAAVASTWRKADGSLYFADWREYQPEMQT
jgi:internalin A